MSDLSGLSDQDLSAIAEGRMHDVSDEALSHIAGGGEEQTFGQKAKDIGLGALGLAGRALDYPAGFVRSGIAAATGQHKEGDFIPRALKGEAPSSSEIMGRAGVPENIGRDVSGFATDMLTDPLNYLSFGGTGALREMLQKAVGKGGSALAKGGEKVYKSARNLQIADKLAADAGKIPVSDVLFKNGITGTSEGMAQKANGLIGTLTQKRDEIVKAADAAGAVADTSKIDEALKNIHDEWFSKGASSAMNPKKAQAFIDAEQTINQYLQPMRELQGGQSTASQLKDILSSLYQNDLSPAAYQAGKVTPETERVLKRGARGMKEGYMDAVTKAVGPEEAAKADALNQQLSSLLSTNKKLMTEGNKTATKVGLGAVDATLSAANPVLAAAKKGGDILGTTWFRTKGGKAMSDVGKSLNDQSVWNKMLATPAGQRALVDMLKGKTNEEEQ